jgi:ATP-dependent RNA helicase RhlE
MLDMGFIRDIRRILAMLPAKRQNLFFSATFSNEIRALADSFLHNPVEVAVARNNATAELISQLVHPVDKDNKRALLARLIAGGDWRQVLVFTRTKHGANRLAEQLDKDGITADAIHGNKSQNARTRALADFKEGKLRVLVATDIAARGLDIEQLPHVVNYELPNVPEDYVHRIGRTGRAGSSGQAVSLVSLDESAFLRDIERLMKLKVERVPVAGFEPSFTMNQFETAPPAPLQQRQQRPPQQRRSTRPAAPGQPGARNGNAARGANGNGASRGSSGGQARTGDRQPQQGRRDAGNDGNRSGSRDGNRGRPVPALLNGNR